MGMKATICGSYTNSISTHYHFSPGGSRGHNKTGFLEVLIHLH